MKPYRYQLNLYYPTKNAVGDTTEAVIGIGGYILSESRKTAREELYRKYEKRDNKIKILSITYSSIFETERKRII